MTRREFIRKYGLWGLVLVIIPAFFVRLFTRPGKVVHLSADRYRLDVDPIHEIEIYEYTIRQDFSVVEEQKATRWIYKDEWDRMKEYYAEAQKKYDSMFWLL